MNRFVLHIILLFFSHLLNAQEQNLVYNGSFEEYSECPVSAEMNNGQFERARGWWIPTLASPDYYHRCNNDNNGAWNSVWIPNNFWGHQETFYGDGYAGFIPVMDGNGLEYEYFRTELISPLKPCIEYRFSMYVSLADYSTHGLSKIGAYFSTDNPYQQNTSRIINNPQIKYTGVPITDTINWTKIEGTFTADGGEQYLTIGFFDENIDTLFVQSSLGFYFHPYYYVDSISLYQVESNNTVPCDFQITFPNVFTPNGDGMNDIINISDLLGFVNEVKILNRWGNVITLLNKDNPIWNGSNCPDGVYYYIFKYEVSSKQKHQSGFIQLVR